VTRIVSGQWGGRRLETPKGEGTRPTSDRVREAMFSTLESELGGFDDEMRVLDLYAGSGALGLEALSRGALTAVFVESDQRAAAVIKRNLAQLGTTHGSVNRMPVERFLEGHDHFDLVFMDPPYSLPSERLTLLIGRLVPMLEPEAIVVVERSTRTPFEWPDGLTPLRDRAYGETHLWYGR
jgi:16S rRNA (guanine966-N2)-methyltransferase